MTNEGVNIGINKSPQKKVVNCAAIEEINDIDNSDIREILEKFELIVPGSAITKDDYESIKRRAVVLAEGLNSEASAGTFIVGAFADRMQDLFSVEIKHISDDVLRKIVYANIGNKITDEEVDMLRKSNLPIQEWLKARSEAKRNVRGFYVAEGGDSVISSRGSSEQDATLRMNKDRDI